MTTTNRTEHFLSFDGVDDYVQARDASVFDVTTGDFDMEVEFRSTDNSGNNVRLLDKRGQGSVISPASYQLSVSTTFSNTGITDTNGNYIGYASNGFHLISFPNDGNWHSARFTWENNTGTGTIYVDGVEEGQLTNPSMAGESITTNRLFTVGGANTGAQFFNGDIKSFRFGTETFLMNEGTGTTITGSEGTVLDIYGATWGSEIK